jgi:XTP/dITP diphosphohydrolase
MEHRLKSGDRLVVATHNRGKLNEFATLLAPHGLGVVLASELGLPEPEETGTTFEENARLKALAAAEAAKIPALADDSGVVVEALDGDPGVYSARWAGPEKDFKAAMAKVEEKLRQAGATTPEKRGARFVAVLCLAFPDGASELYRGEVAGTMVWPPRGTGGFGYDPMFVPSGLTRTFAEITPEEKHAVSHRARAFARFAEARLTKSRGAPPGATGTIE